MPLGEGRWLVFDAFRAILKHLGARRKRQFWFLLGVMLFAAGFETLAVGSIAFLASAVSDPETVMKSTYVALMNNFFHFDFLTEKSGFIIALSVLVVCMVAGKNGLLAAINYWNLRFGANIDGFFGERLLRGFIQLPYEWHLYRNSADLVLAVNWRYYVGTYFINTTLQTLCDCSVVLFLFVTLLILEPIVSLVAIGIVGASAVLIFRCVRRKLDSTATLRGNYEEIVNRHVTKVIHGVKDVKVFGREQYFVRDYIQDVYPLARYMALLNFISRLPSWILETVGFLLVTVTICLMLFLMNASAAKAMGVIALLVVAAWRILPATNRILAGFTQLRSSLPYIKKVMAYLDEVGVAMEGFGKTGQPGSAVELRFDRELKLDNVSFTYQHSGNPTLKGIDLEIQKGQTIGLIGLSGAGKSTLVDILIGLLIPTEGAMYVDNRKLDAGLRHAWMKHIGYVSQAPYIYDGTLAENIAFGLGKEEIDRDWVRECCRMAAMDFLDELPNGIDAAIGERGVRLSGGQRQRVAIARALYRHPQIMVFDEATGALDSKNEKEILKTIYSLKGKVTMVVVAHRLSTLSDCDMLVCIENGSIVKEGDPDAVLPWYTKHMEQSIESGNGSHGRI